MNDGRQSVPGVLRQFKQPEYTGENRCLPCTVLNAAIATVASGVVALVSPPLGLLAFVACLVVIAVRGYLVPGTPALVRHLPETVHEAIGSSHGVGESTFDVERTLTEADIVVECPETDDLCLTDSFRTAWQTRMGELRDEDSQRYQLSDSLAVPANEVTFEETDTGWYVYINDVSAGRWQSRAAFVADLASEALLGARLGEWESLAPEQRTRLLVALRSFVEQCPDCGGEVVPDEDVVRTCCRDDLVSVTTTCVDCGSVLFEGTEA